MEGARKDEARRIFGGFFSKKLAPEEFGSPWYPPDGGYGMGEEKPEEELMGKLSLLRGDGILLCRHFYLFP
jgi:hypothetical protein